MRDIKYRAWIKPHVDYVGGKMWQVVGMTWREYVDDGEPENPVHNRVFDIDIQDIEEFDKGWSSKTAWQHLEPEDFELIEFTGLKDRNGVEIYEGDILKHIMHYPIDFQAENPDKKYGSVHGPVSWIDGWLYINANGKGENLLYKEIAKNYEVVGNIYEDPDLLKV